MSDIVTLIKENWEVISVAGGAVLLAGYHVWKAVVTWTKNLDGQRKAEEFGEVLEDLGIRPDDGDDR